jgi:hypothetical protein
MSATKKRLTVETALRIFGGGHVVILTDCQHCDGLNGHHRIVKRVWPNRVDLGCHFCGRALDSKRGKK